MVKVNKTGITIEKAQNYLFDCYSQWRNIYLNGCADPLWYDGAILNLIRNRIISKHKEIEENLNFWDYPDYYSMPIPIALPDSFMSVGRNVFGKFIEATKNRKSYKECVSVDWGEMTEPCCRATREKRGKFYIITSQSRLVKICGYVVARAGIFFGIHQNTENDYWRITLLKTGEALTDSLTEIPSFKKAIELLNDFDLSPVRDKAEIVERHHKILRLKIMLHKKDLKIAYKTPAKIV